jgi:hypothetical protein
MDETCDELETKQISKEWKHAGFPRNKNICSQKCVGKVLAFVFCDEDGITFTDYLQRRKSIT